MAEKVPEDGWTMQDGTPWPGNNVRDHPGMIQVCICSFVLFYLFGIIQLKVLILCRVLSFQQVFLGHDGVHDIEGNELPHLIYVSREKRPGFDHHKKAGAMNALVILPLLLGFSSVFSFGITVFG